MKTWITVTKGMSGYFAVEMGMSPSSDGMGEFPEPWSTGIGRYKTYFSAREEAVEWAEECGLPFEEGRNEGPIDNSSTIIEDKLLKILGKDATIVNLDQFTD